jgi:MFS family permease
MAVAEPRAGAVVAAALLVMPSLGALYAWSVLVGPLEQRFGLARSETSFVFSLATVSFTLAMMLAPRLHGRSAVPALALLAMTMAAAGLAVAAAGEAYWTLLLGVGGLFGLANGIGYSLCLQAVNTAVVRRRGLATGLIVASYTMGAAVLAPLFSWLVRTDGVVATLSIAAALMLVVGILAAALLHRAGVRLHAEATFAGDGRSDRRVFWWLWLGFLAGSGTGVMALGHAATIAVAYGAGTDALVAATVLAALGNGAGRLAGGWLGDRLAPRRALAPMQLLLAAALALPLAAPGVPAALAALLLVGIGYGATASLYPLAVAHYYGAARLSRMYGRVYTAWGVAGLGAPWLAGLLFDATGDYAAAIWVGLAAGLIAAFASLQLPDHPNGGTGTR